MKAHRPVHEAARAQWGAPLGAWVLWACGPAARRLGQDCLVQELVVSLGMQQDSSQHEGREAELAVGQAKPPGVRPTAPGRGQPGLHIPRP